MTWGSVGGEGVTWSCSNSENVWSPADLEVISKFFKAEVCGGGGDGGWGVGRGSMFTRCCCLYQVAHRPFSGAAMLGFVRILLLPLPTLRSCVQLMQMHMVSTVHSYCQLRVDLLWCMCCRFLCLGLYGAFHCA